jgi:hypothetical protein
MAIADARARRHSPVAMPAPDSPSLAPSPRLGVAGAADTLKLLAPGEVYAIAADSQPLRLVSVAQALAASLETGAKCTLLVPGDPASFVAKAHLAGIDLKWHEGSGDLALVRLRSDPALPLFRAGPSAVLDTIDRAVAADRLLVVLENAETVLFLSDPAHAAEAAQGLLDWARRRGVAVIVTFTPATRPQREFLSLRAVAEDFAGFATLREYEGGALLDVQHWFGAAGAQPRGSLALQMSPRGGVSMAPSMPLPTHGQDAGTPRVIAIESALDDPLAAVRDAGWAIVNQHAEAIDAVRRLAAGAVILAFERDTPLRALCHTVASLRRVAAPWVSIVVRERGVRLRLGQQVALTRLGASTVVPERADDADLAQAVRALAGNAFLRALPEDVEATFAAAGTATAPQLMVTRAFRDMVAEVLAASDGIQLPHALVHVPCDPAKAQQLGTFALQRRLRDAAMTVDPSGLWVFLHSCPASRASSVAVRAFGRYHPEVADTMTIEGTTGAIARRLERLAAAVGVRDAVTVRPTPPVRGTPRSA